jgi:hypothetical protein
MYTIRLLVTRRLLDQLGVLERADAADRRPGGGGRGTCPVPRALAEPVPLQFLRPVHARLGPTPGMRHRGLYGQHTHRAEGNQRHGGRLQDTICKYYVVNVLL